MQIRLRPSPVWRWSAAAALGGLGATFLFDVASQGTRAPCFDFTSPGRTIQITALLGAAVAVVALSYADVVPRGPARRGILLLDLALVCGSGAWLLRRDLDTCVSATSGTFVLSATALALWLIGMVVSMRSIGDGSSRPLLDLLRLSALGTTLMVAMADIGSYVEAPTRLPRASFWLLAMSIVGAIVSFTLDALLRGGDHGLGDRRRQRAARAIIVAALAASLWARTGGDYTRPPVVWGEIPVGIALAGWVSVSLHDVDRAERTSPGGR